jgi:hypothetical protein
LLYREWVTRIAWAEHNTAREVGEQFLRLAEGESDPCLLMMGHSLFGTSLMTCGDLTTARADLEQALALNEPERDRPLAFRYGQDPRCAIRAHLAVILWMSGAEDEGVAVAEDALLEAQRIGHANTIGYTASFGPILVHQFRRDYVAVQTYARTTISLAREHQLSQWATFARVAFGWVRATREGSEEGLAAMQAGAGTV